MVHAEIGVHKPFLHLTAALENINVMKIESHAPVLGMSGGIRVDAWITEIGEIVPRIMITPKRS